MKIMRMNVIFLFYPSTYKIYKMINITNGKYVL